MNRALPSRGRYGRDGCLEVYFFVSSRLDTPRWEFVRVPSRITRVRLLYQLVITGQSLISLNQPEQPVERFDLAHAMPRVQ